MKESVDKWNDKQDEADSFLHNTISHTHSLYPNLQVLAVVIPGQSMKEIVLERK